MIRRLLLLLIVTLTLSGSALAGVSGHQHRYVLDLTGGVYAVFESSAPLTKHQLEAEGGHLVDHPRGPRICRATSKQRVNGKRVTIVMTLYGTNPLAAAACEGWRQSG